MAKRDYEKAASRFSDAVRRITAGLELERQRVLDREAQAPRLLPNSAIAVTFYGPDNPDNDLDYYIYELARLSEAGKSIIKVFGKPQDLINAQTKFESGIPRLREIRNPLTHPNDNDELDEVAWFSSVVRLTPDGRSVDLVDPRYEHHDFAVEYAEALRAYLSAHTQEAIAADPPLPIDQQIANRRPTAALTSPNRSRGRATTFDTCAGCRCLRYAVRSVCLVKRSYLQARRVSSGAFVEVVLISITACSRRREVRRRFP